MSVEAMVLALNHSAASGTAKVVLAGIANHDGDGGAWPTIATLARYANVSTSAVQRAIATLVKMGEILVHTNAGGTRETRGDRRPNRYEILLACPPGCDRTMNHRVALAPPRDLDGAASTEERGRDFASDGVASARPEPSLEPSMNRPERAARAQSDDLAKRRERKTDPRADGLVREWWEGLDPRPLQPWPAVVGIVSKALGGGWTEEECREALSSCDPPLSGGLLDGHLRRARNRRGAAAARARLDPGHAG